MSDRRSQSALDGAQRQREHWARELAEQDRDLLDLRAQGKTFAAIATMLGISRAAAHERVAAATRRQRTREALRLNADFDHELAEEGVRTGAPLP